MRSTVDRRAVARLTRHKGVHAYLYYTARRAANEAYRFAPRRRGYYRGAIFAQRGRGIRASAFYGSKDWKALFVEHGTVHSVAHHPLIRAAQALDLRVVPYWSDPAGGDE